MSHLVVKSHRPLQWSLAIIILSAMIAIITWLLLDRSHWSLIYDRFSRTREVKQMLESNRNLREENKKLRERVLMLERMVNLDQNTASLLHNDMKGMQDEIYRLKGELEFYQGITSTARDSSGLNIHGIHIESLQQARSYRLKLILTHVVKGDKVAEGVMNVSLEGIQDGVTRTLKLQDVTLDETLEMKFKFRNFKRFETNLTLPEDFIPRKVHVNLQPRDRKQTKIKKVFDWPISAG